MHAEELFIYRLLLCASTILIFTSKEALSTEHFKRRDTSEYDARIRPPGVNDTAPTVVTIHIYYRSISKIDDVSMEYNVQITFLQRWQDLRLQFDNKEGKLPYKMFRDVSKLWIPDLYFTNEISGHTHDILAPNLYIKVFPDGSVHYSQRVSLTLACPMNLKLYPFDRQTCSIKVASYGLSTNDLVLQWEDASPVQVVKNLYSPRFTLERFITDYCNSKTTTGEYSCLTAQILLKREASFHIIHCYLPTCLCVIVSWLPFFMDVKAVVTRLSIGITNMLIMVSLVYACGASHLPVSYTKAIDIWIGVCFTFVFCAVLEYVLVNHGCELNASRKNARKAQQERAPGLEENAAAENSQLHADDREDEDKKFVMKPLMRRRQTDPVLKNGGRCADSGLCLYRRINVLSRLIFPLLFCFFNAVYWLAYL